MTTEQRLEKLERELSRATRCNSWLLAALAVFLGVWVIGESFGPETARAQPTATAFKEVRANRIVVVDKEGKGRIVLGLMSKFGPTLGVLDEKGRTRVLLGTKKTGPTLCMYDEKGRQRAILGGAGNGAVLSLFDKGKPRAGLMGGEEGMGLTLFDEAGEFRAGLGVTKHAPDVLGFSLVGTKGRGGIGLAVNKAGPRLSLSDGKGKDRAVLVVGKDATVLGFSDEKARLRITMGLTKDEPAMMIWDKRDVMRASLGSNTTSLPDGRRTIYPESSLQLFGPNGTVLWQAP